MGLPGILSTLIFIQFHFLPELPVSSFKSAESRTQLRVQAIPLHSHASVHTPPQMRPVIFRFPPCGRGGGSQLGRRKQLDANGSTSVSLGDSSGWGLLEELVACPQHGLSLRVLRARKAILNGHCLPGIRVSKALVPAWAEWWAVQ